MTFEIRFDYRFDVNGFFDAPDRRAALEEAGRIWENLIGDEFQDVPTGTTFTISNPSDASARETIVLDAPIDDLLIFVGSESLGGPLARGGASGFDASGDVFSVRISSDFRGTGPVTNYEPWAGVLRFDPDKDWSFDLDDAVEGKSDFISTALHEIGHVLGIGNAVIFETIGAGGAFDGPNALDANGGDPIPLEADLSHVVDGFAGDTVLMDPSSVQGQRLTPSPLDLAMLADIGYEVEGFTAQGSTPDIVTDGPDETVFGTILGDRIDALAGDDVVSGNAGDDTLSGGDGDDTLFGQEGADHLFGNAGHDRVQGGEGDDSLSGNAGDDTLSGQEGQDVLDGGEGNDLLQGRDGNDTLTAQHGTDTLFGGEGTDVFHVLAGAAQVRISDFDLSSEVIYLENSGFSSVTDAVAAITRPFSNVSRITFLGSGTLVDVFHDSSTTTPLTESHFRLGAIDGEGTGLAGGPENDTIIAEGDNDYVEGLGGNDSLDGGGGDDTVLGGSGDDTLHGAEGNDSLDGGAGNDLLYVSFGNDLLAGGDGTDRASFGIDYDFELFSELPSGSIHIQSLYGDDTLTGIEELLFADGEIVQVADLFDDDEALIGTAENDRLVGGNGNDSIDGGLGSDTLNGAEGNDTIVGGPGEDDLRDVIYAGDGDDSVDGGAGNDLIFGMDGNDTIAGGAGVDDLQGQAGDDVITGSNYSDLIDGGGGDDFINGGFGHDRLVGNVGADKFFHVGVLGHGSDWIQDYSSLSGDVLLWGGVPATADDFQVNFNHTANSAGERSGDDNVEEAFVIYRPTKQIVWALVDGSGAGQVNLQIGGEVFDLLV